jgi:hypothetical protein
MTMREAAGGAGNIDEPERDHDDELERPSDRAAVDEPIGGVVGGLAGGAIGTTSVDARVPDRRDAGSADPERAGER